MTEKLGMYVLMFIIVNKDHMSENSLNAEVTPDQFVTKQPAAARHPACELVDPHSIKQTLHKVVLFKN